MTSEMTQDWNPGTYQRFRGLRLQPALDLLAAVGDLPNGSLVDLGCGTGVVGPELAARFPRRLIVGVDGSPAMLSQAARVPSYGALQEADIAQWRPDETPALIYSNAALQWLDAHDTLLPRLIGYLPAGGVLAVQMPNQTLAPSHQGWRVAFEGLHAARSVDRSSEILTPAAYFDLLSPLGELRLWQTDYFQHLEASETGHPVRHFTQSTYARPFLDAVSQDETPELIAAYEDAMAKAYPLRSDGSVVFAFRRLFFTLRLW